jgi:pimeloyl-ACP methyl ester carboxylesterase
MSSSHRCRVRLFRQADRPRLDPERIARAWAELMKRLGYTRYVAQGGDWGTPISSAMARQAAVGLHGIHINLPATVPPEVAAALAGGPVPAGLSEKETRGAGRAHDVREERQLRTFITTSESDRALRACGDVTRGRQDSYYCAAAVRGSA